MRRQGKEYQDRGTERRFGAGRDQQDRPPGRSDFARGGDERPRSFEPRGRPSWNEGGSSNGGSAPFNRGGQQTGTYRRDGGAQGGYGRPQGAYGRPQGNFDRPQGNFDRPQGSFDRDRPQGKFDRPRNNFDRPQGGGFDRAQSSAPRTDAAPAARAAAPSVVGVQQLKAGIGQANRALAEVVEQFGHTLRGDYDIGAIEVTVSFDAQGRFLGFGSGGAAQMKLQLTPLDAESVVEGEGAEDEFVSAAASDEGDEAEDEDEAQDDEDDGEDEDESADDVESDDDDVADEDEDEDNDVLQNGVVDGSADKAAHFDA